MNTRTRKFFTRSLVATALAAALHTAPILAAQTNGGMLKGQVMSVAGQQLDNVIVTVKHKAKGITRTVVSNSDGEYTLRNLPVGDYTLSLRKDGFAPFQETDITINVGAALIFNGQLSAGNANLETIEVRGATISRLDTSSSGAGVTFDQEKLNLMPVENGFENMALMAPGTARNGGENFKGASSFGGGSAAENGYYLNGMNVGVIRTGLGAIRLPWEAIRQTEIKTGGISPEFGGAIGGIVNAVSKSGDNEFKFGGQYRIDPDSLHSPHDSVYRDDGSVEINNESDYDQYTETRLWASGPIIQDKAFFYALYSPREERDKWAEQSTAHDRKRTEDQMFVKLDWFINEDHSIDLTYINNKREWTTRNYAYELATNTIGRHTGDSDGEDGGSVLGLHYSAFLTDNLSMDVVIGRTQEEVVDLVENNQPLVQDCRDTNNCTDFSNHSNATIYDEEYTRDQYRIDFRYDLEDHSIQAGVDIYQIDVLFESQPNGDGSAQGWWSLRDNLTSDQVDLGLPEGTEYIRNRTRLRGTNSEINSIAYYLQDDWQVTDDITLNLGVRYSSFENTVTDGRAYVDVDGQLSPRLGISWDVNGDGSSKAFATFGRYFQPVSSNMNITQGSRSRETFDYYHLGEVGADGLPVLLADGSPSRGDAIVPQYVRQQGITEPGLIASSSLDAMYSDEITFGFQSEVFDDMSAGIRFIHRELKRSIEDTDVGPILAQALADAGIEDNVGQSSYYVVLNPGDDVNISYDFDGDGTVDNINLSAEDMDLPKASRKYLAIETTLDGQVTDDLTIAASYTWSHSYGNTEGLVRTDNDQADPGWTVSYDYGDLMDHSYGNLPNDHRHAFKLAGSYNITENLILGFVSRFTSGRPQNKFSRHPFGVDRCATGPWSDSCTSYYYGNYSFYDENNEPAPRGSAGTLPWQKELDLSLTYNTQLFDGNLTLKATVYNVFGNDDALGIQEGRTVYNADGTQSVSPNYGITTIQQKERYGSLIMRYDF